MKPVLTPPARKSGSSRTGLQERDVGGDAADAELGQRAAGAVDGRLERPAAAGELGQQRVEVRRDLGPGVGGAAVEADARAARRAVRGDDAGVRAEAVGRVLGGDPALQRGAADPDAVLREPQVGQRLARRDAQLRLHQVDVGDLLGHGVLDLDARVHLDEDVAAGRVDQELDRARVDVPDLGGEPDRVGADPRAQVRRRDAARARSRRPSGGGAAPSSRARTGGSRRLRRRPGSAPRCGAGR